MLRRLDEVPWWSRPLAVHLFNRERRALAAANRLGIAPPLLYDDDARLVRGYIPGSALKIARPYGDLVYFRRARAALHALHRLSISHNDLAKEQNWLRSPDGHAYLLDFQLASTFRRRNRVFRILAYEDLRHFLKHKRRYVPDALTAMEKRVLARKSLPTRIWMATGKKVYMLVTRGLFGFIDAEGGGTRMAKDAPAIDAALRKLSGVRDVAMLDFPDRMSGVGLYAFVEADPGVDGRGTAHRAGADDRQGQAPGIHSGRGNAAAARRRHRAGGYSAAHQHQPGRPDRAAGDLDAGGRARRGHRRRAQKSFRRTRRRRRAEIASRRTRRRSARLSRPDRRHRALRVRGDERQRSPKSSCATASSRRWARTTHRNSSRSWRRCRATRAAACAPTSSSSSPPIRWTTSIR